MAIDCLRGIFVYLFFFIWFEDTSDYSSKEIYFIYSLIGFGFLLIISGAVLVTEIKEIKICGLSWSFGNYNDS